MPERDHRGTRFQTRNSLLLFHSPSAPSMHLPIVIGGCRLWSNTETGDAVVMATSGAGEFVKLWWTRKSPGSSGCTQQDILAHLEPLVSLPQQLRVRLRQDRV